MTITVLVTITVLTDEHMPSRWKNEPALAAHIIRRLSQATFARRVYRAAVFELSSA